MRKKYIEDNDEQDPELIKKVAPFYQRTSQILGGTQVAFVIYCGIFAISLLTMVISAHHILSPLVGDQWDWVLDVVLAVAVILLVGAYWVVTILYPGTHALVEPLPVLASTAGWCTGTATFSGPSYRWDSSWYAAFSG